jgi:hypothetical protein
MSDLVLTNFKFYRVVYTTSKDSVLDHMICLRYFGLPVNPGELIRLAIVMMSSTVSNGSHSDII